MIIRWHCIDLLPLSCAFLGLSATASPFPAPGYDVWMQPCGMRLFFFQHYYWMSLYFVMNLFGRMLVYRMFSIRQTAAAVLFTLLWFWAYLFSLRVAHCCPVFSLFWYMSAKKNRFLPLRHIPLHSGVEKKVLFINSRSPQSSVKHPVELPRWVLGFKAIKKSRLREWEHNRRKMDRRGGRPVTLGFHCGTLK